MTSRIIDQTADRRQAPVRRPPATNRRRTTIGGMSSPNAQDCSGTLVLPLSGPSAHALDAVRRHIGAAESTVFPLAQLLDGSRRDLRARSYEWLAIVGAPPGDEIGYAFSPLIALLGR